MISILSSGPDLETWDAFIAGLPGSTFCHLSGWHDIMTDVMGHECFYVVATDDHGSWTAVLPLVRVRNPLFGHFLLSMPFLNSGGPVGSPAGLAALVSWAEEEAKRSRADLLELRSRVPVPGDLRVSHRKITVSSSPGSVRWTSAKSAIAKQKKTGLW